MPIPATPTAASLQYPDTGTRLVQYANGDFAAKAVAVLYADQAATSLAEIYADNSGVPGARITNAAVTLDAYGQQPVYWGPADGTDHLWITVDGGPLTRVDAAFGPRIAAGAATLGDAARRSANLTDLASAAAARTALGLGTAATTNTGTAAGNTVLGNDSRLSDARTPTAHAASHGSAGSDPVAVAIAQVTGLAGMLGSASLAATSTKTADYAITSGQLVPADATSGAFTITLPAASGAAQIVAVKKLDATVNKVTISAAGSDVINVAATSVSVGLQDEVLTLASSGAGLWLVVSGQKSLGTLDGRYQKNFAELVVTDPQWGYLPGQTDLYGPLTAAIASLGVAGGKIVIPPGTGWTLSQPVNIKTGVHIEGAGKQATKVTATAGCFWWSTGVHEFHIEHLRLDATGGHIFWSTNGSPFYKTQLKHLMLNQNDTNYSIAYHHGAGDWDKVIFEDCDMVRVAGSLYPAFDLVNSGNAANENVWRDCGVDGQNVTSSPFFWLENTSTANYAWDNVFENITGERNPAGIVRALSHRNLRIVNVTDWDATVNYVASHVHVGKSTASGAVASKNIFIAGCGRRIGGSSAFAGTYDVNLPSGEVQYVDVFSPHNNGVSGSVNFSTSDFVNVWGAGSLAWTGQPAGVGNHIGSGIDINGPVLISGTRRSAGTVAPNGAVTGNVGDEYTNTSGGVGTTKWFKETGTGTTGWVAFDTGISVPRSVLSGARLLLNGHPYPAGVGTGTWAKDTWRFAPISLYSAMPVSFLATVATTLASGGTAAQIFALYSLDAYNRPGAVSVDYSSYGSIDLTAGSAGAEKTLTTSGLTIPAGDWYLGTAWTGTATGSPVMDMITGNHPQVASNAPGANNNAYTQAVSGASPPSPVVLSGAATQGVAVWAVLG